MSTSYPKSTLLQAAPISGATSVHHPLAKTGLSRNLANYFLKVSLLMLLAVSGLKGWGQRTIFSENMGTASGTLAISANSFQNSSLTFTGTGDTRSTTVSNYSGASGGRNVFLTPTSGTNFQIAGISTVNYSSLSLSFGIFKSTTTGNGSDLIVEVSTDGTTFSTLSFTALTTGAGSAIWYLRTASGTIPSTANLRIRFRQNGTATQYRIDDVILTGTPANPTTTSISPTSATAGGSAFALTVNGTNFISGVSTVTWNGSNRTTTFVSSTQVTAAITAVDIASAGSATVGVTTTGAATAASNTQSFTINAATTPLVTLSTSANAGTEEGTTEITVTANASAAVSVDQTVALGVSGTGITTDDYTLSNVTITIPSGNTSGSVTFTVSNDALIEGLETAILTISNPSPGLTLGGTITQNIAITDNDFPTVNLSVTANAGTEAGSTAITVRATASQAVVGAQTVSLGVTGTGITAEDYTLSNTTITIANNATVGSVTFTVVNDAIYEGNETATLAISNPSPGLTLGATTTQDIVITDDEIAPPANDDCNQAIDLTVNAAAIPGTFAGATAMTGATRNDVFYSFTPTTTGPHTVTISNFSAAGDKDLFVYSTCPSTYSTTTNVVASGRTGSPTSETATSADFTEGISYKILVQDFAAVRGTFSISVSGPLPSCTTPADAASGLSFSDQTTTAISGSFSKAITEPTGGYLVIQSTSSTLSANPADATAYLLGDIVGGGNVAANIPVNGDATYNFSSFGTLASNTEYFYYVIPYNFQLGNCNYAYGNAVLISGSTFTCPGALATPTTGTITSTSAIINFANATGTGTISYDLQWRVAGGTFATISNITSPYTLAIPLSPGTSYEVQVRASNAVCTGAYSTGLTFSTAAITAPEAIAADNINGLGFIAKWTAVTEATSYKLDVSKSNTFSAGSLATDLFISEYLEGSGNNKYIEIYNGTGSAVDLSNYQLRLYTNGASDASTTVVLAGTLSSGATIVYKNSLSNIYTGTVTNNTAVNFNGDDAIALFKISTAAFVDIIGFIGNDPGTAWTSGLFSTLDKTLVRKSTVTGGITTNPASGFPTLSTEWDLYNIDNVSNLGSHNASSPSFFTGYQDLTVNATVQAVSIAADPAATYYYRVRAVSANSTSVNSNTITVNIPAPTISSFTPTYGGTLTTVEITGTNFLGATAVSFGGVATTLFVVESNTVIRVTLDAAVATGTVAVTTAGGTAISAGTFTYSPSTTWNGSAGGNWSNAANWTPGVPHDGLDVIINSGYPILDVDYLLSSSKSITIGGTGSLEMNADLGIGGTLTLTGTTSSLIINPNKTLAINGEVDFGGNSVTLKSTDAGTGSIGKITGTLSGATNVTVERYIPAHTYRAWRLLSVPTKGSQTIRQAWQDLADNQAGEVINDINYGTLITTPNLTQTLTENGFDKVSVANSLLTYNGTSWIGATSTKGAIGATDAEIANNPSLATTKAYFLYVRGSRAEGTNGLLTDVSPTTLRTTGELYQGTITSPLIEADKYAVIGNIYPSRVNFEELLKTSTGIDEVYYIWDAKKKSGNSLGAYQTFSGELNGYLAMLEGGSFDVGSPYTNIEQGQAFFVHTTGTTGTVGFTEAAKVAGSSSNGFRPATPAANRVSFTSNLYTTGTGSYMVDANKVVFDDQYSNAVDGKDALKMSNTGENFAIQQQNKKLAIEGRQLITIKDTIFYNMWNLQKRTYQLELKSANLNAPGLTAILQDAYTGANTVLNLGISNKINFTVDATAASSAANRFRVVFAQTALAPLPVSFISVSANRTTAGNAITWKVAAESNMAQYEVERSANGRSFAKTGTVAASAQITYSFTDAQALSGTAFYRIKGIGLSGDVKYSNIVKLTAGNIKPGFSISPNPAEGNMVKLQFKNQVAGNYTVSISSINGQRLYTSKVAHAGGSSSQVLNITERLAAGTYQLEIVSPDKSRQTQSLVVKAND